MNEILLKGSPEDVLKALIVKFSLPENCNLFGAPKLNELINFVPNSIILRDQRIIKRQEKISASLSAIAGAISWVMKTKSTPGWKETLETLSDASKIIADLQPEESVIRRNLILSNVDDSMKETLLATQIGEFLFGQDLEEKVKAAKALQSTAKDLKKPLKNTQSMSSKKTPGPRRVSRIRSRNNDRKRQAQLVEELCSKGAVQKCTYVEDQFFPPTFLVPKPDGTSRFILNLKKLNEFIDPVHLEFEDGRTVCRLLFQNWLMATLDLKDAYYSIPIYEYHRKYLRFYCNGQLYEFKCLPFGLCTAPYVFTKTMKPVVSFLRKKGITMVIYIDDILFIEKSDRAILKNLRYRRKNFVNFSVLSTTRLKWKLNFHNLKKRKYSI